MLTLTFISYVLQHSFYRGRVGDALFPTTAMATLFLLLIGIGFAYQAGAQIVIILMHPTPSLPLSQF